MHWMNVKSEKKLFILLNIIWVKEWFATHAYRTDRSSMFFLIIYQLHLRPLWPTVDRKSGENTTITVGHSGRELAN